MNFRKAITITNSDAKCLLENWLEERAVDHIDYKYKLCTEKETQAKLLRNGHDGILTTSFSDPLSDITTYKFFYKQPVFCSVRQIGQKTELRKKFLTEKFSHEMLKRLFDAPSFPVEPYQTTFQDSYNIDKFVSVPPKPTQSHHYRMEQPVSYWTEHKDKIHAVSAIKTKDTPFRKNDTFSTPINEYLDETHPWSLENYPKM